MKKDEQKNPMPTEFREYILPKEFPVLVLTPGNVTAKSIGKRYHFHNYIEIGLCLHGSHILNFENHSYTLQAGDFFVLSPFSMHYVDHTDENGHDCCKYLYVDPELLLRDFYPAGLPHAMQWYKNSESPFLFSKETAPIVYQLLSILLNSYEQRECNNPLLIQGLFQTIMVELTRSLSSHAVSDIGKYHDINRLLPALKKVHSDYSLALTAATLSAECNLSESTFRLLFRKHLKMTPGGYLTELRLQKARELLYGTELPILDIALEVGFTSLTSFYQNFQKQYHTSPGKWREMNRKVHRKNIKHSPLAPSGHNN